jgi:hypothetical protein
VDRSDHFRTFLYYLAMAILYLANDSRDTAAAAGTYRRDKFDAPPLLTPHTSANRPLASSSSTTSQLLPR